MLKGARMLLYNDGKCCRTLKQSSPTVRSSLPAASKQNRKNNYKGSIYALILDANEEVDSSIAGILDKGQISICSMLTWIFLSIHTARRWSQVALAFLDWPCAGALHNPFISFFNSSISFSRVTSLTLSAFSCFC